MVQKINSLLAATALCSVLAVGFVNAKEVQTNMARMQAMDKVTGKVSEIDVPVNGETQFGTFSIVVRYCAARTPEEMPENFAFVDVVDNYKSDNPVNIFKGWMVSSSPALNAVEHPIYDVWLLKCLDGDAAKLKQLSAEQLKARDELIKARPSEDNLSAEAQKALEDEAKEKAAQEAVKMSEPVVQPATEAKPEAAVEAPAMPAADAAAVVTETAPAEIIPAEEGAPKPLFNLQQEPVTSEPALPQTAPEAVVEQPAEDVSGISLDTVVEQVIESPAPTTDQPEEVLAPAAESAPTVVDDGLLVPELDESEEQPNQLIKFDDEVEEESFDLDAEALAN